MTTTMRESELAVATCPTWCTGHPYTVEPFLVHTADIEVDGMSVRAEARDDSDPVLYTYVSEGMKAGEALSLGKALLEATERLSARWWRYAPNPPCQPWCTDEHETNEFRGLGLVSCGRTAHRGSWFTIRVNQITGADETPGCAGKSTVYEATIDTEFDDPWTEHSLAEVGEYATALSEAVAWTQATTISGPL